MNPNSPAVSLWWARLRQVDPGLLVVACLPLLLLLVNPGGAFPPSFGHCDSWLYTGYFVNFSDHMRVHANRYYGTRMSWTLLGAAAHHLFEPQTAHYVLRLFLCYLSLGSLYLVLRETVSRRAGLLGVLFMGCSTAFLATIGWDYHDNIDNGLFLLILLCLTLAARRDRWRLWLVTAGLCLTALLNIQLFFITFVPLLAVYYLVLNRWGRRNPLLPSVVLVSAGALTWAVLLGVVYAQHAGTFFWFMPCFRTAKSLAEANPYKDTSYQWVARSVHLALPTVLTLGTALLLAVGLAAGFLRRRPMVVVFQVFLLVTAATMVAWELQGQIVLQFWMYASYLLPATCLAVGAQLGFLTEGLPRRTLLVLGVVFVATWALPQARFAELRAFPPYSARLAALVLCVGLVGLAFLALACRHPRFLAAAIACLGFCNWAAHNPYLQYANPKDANNKESFVAVVRASRLVASWVGSTNDYRICYDVKERSEHTRPRQIGYVFHSLDNLFLGSSQRYDAPVELSRHPRVIFLTARAGGVEQACKAFHCQEHELRLVEEREVHEGDVRFRMLLLEPTRRPANGLALTGRAK